MRKGFLSLSTLLLMGFTLLLGVGGSEMIKESQTDGCANATLLLRDIDSGLLWMEIEQNENISEHLRYEEMPEGMTFQTDADLVYVRDDGVISVGIMAKKDLLSWLRCKKDV